MADPSGNFSDVEALNVHVQTAAKGAMLITHENCADYPGMVLSIMIVFDVSASTFQLDLQWMSFGLDPYGDTLQESYVYEFDSLEALLSYLLKTYAIAATDIPIRYSKNALLRKSS